MALPDPLRSNAVLIGFQQRPQELQDLLRVLTEPEHGRLHRDRCTVLTDAPGPNDIVAVLIRATQDATDTLLVHWAGPALIEDGELYLVLPQTDPERLAATAVPYDTVRRILLRNLRRRRLIVVLDSDLSEHLGLAEIEGACVVVGSGLTGAVLIQLTSSEPFAYENLASVGAEMPTVEKELVLDVRQLGPTVTIDLNAAARAAVPTAPTRSVPPPGPGPQPMPGPQSGDTWTSPGEAPPVPTVRAGTPVPPMARLQRPRPTARKSRIDKISLGIAAAFGLIGFALFNLVFSVAPLPAAAVAILSTVAIYLGRSPLPRNRRR